MDGYSLQVIGFAVFVLALYFLFTWMAANPNPYHHHHRPLLSVSEFAMIIVCILIILAAIFWR